MKVKLTIAAIMFVALAVLLAVNGTSSLAAERVLTPRADSPTAMRHCGATIEAVKNRLGATTKYVFTGQETLTHMHYCVEGSTTVVDERNTYKVPRGTVGWLAANGRVVLEGCVNDAKCIGCTLPAVLAPLPPSTPPIPVPDQPRTSPRTVRLESSVPGHNTIAEVYRVVPGKVGDDFLASIDGRQHRELTVDEIRAAKKAGAIRLYEGRGVVRFTLNGMDWQKLAGMPVGLGKRVLTGEEVLPVTVDPRENAARIMIQRGKAVLTVPRSAVVESSQRTTELILEDDALVVFRGPIYHSCGVVSSTLCGNGPPKEWHRQVHELQWQWTLLLFFVQ